jgi:type VI secretion system protein ImpC
VLENNMTVGKDSVVAGIKDQIAKIDEQISDQLNEIMHAPEFQKLEASWRGLHYLVMNTETGTMLKLRLLNVTRDELLSDMEKATEFDQSALFKKVYEEEYGTFGGNPFTVLVGDYEFGRHPQDIATLEKISNVAAAAHAPFIASASPKLFDMDSFTELGIPRDLAKGFESTELVKWRSFRESEDSRYVVLTLPHVLLRLPYGPDTVPVEGFNFEEDVDGKDHSRYLWGNPAYALAQRVNNAFSLYKWCAAIRGVEGGGLVEGLPAHTFKTDEGDIALKCPTEIAITDRRENELNNLGFISILHRKGTDQAAFFGGTTTNKPKLYNTNEANANSRISAMLPYILAASRFAHYIKVIMRDKIGSFMTRDNVAKYLNTWIADYVLLNDDAPQSVKAQYPLREGRVDVFDIPGKPGCYRAVVFLKPHFQLDELTVSIRLVAELPPPAK